MQVELSAKGTPAEIIASIGHDVTVARKANDSEAHVLYAVRDYVYRLCKDAPEDAQLSVAVAIDVSVGRGVDAVDPTAQELVGNES